MEFLLTYHWPLSPASWILSFPMSGLSWLKCLFSRSGMLRSVFWEPILPCDKVNVFPMSVLWLALMSRWHRLESLSREPHLKKSSDCVDWCGKNPSKLWATLSVISPDQKGQFEKGCSVMERLSSSHCALGKEETQEKMPLVFSKEVRKTLPQRMELLVKKDWRSQGLLPSQGDPWALDAQLASTI